MGGGREGCKHSCFHGGGRRFGRRRGRSRSDNNSADQRDVVACERATRGRRRAEGKKEVARARTHTRAARSAAHGQPAQQRTLEQNAAERAPRAGGRCALGHGHLLGVVEHEVHKLVEADDAAFNPQARLLVQPHGNARALAGGSASGAGQGGRVGTRRPTHPRARERGSGARGHCSDAPSAKIGR